MEATPPIKSLHRVVRALSAALWALALVACRDAPPSSLPPPVVEPEVVATGDAGDAGTSSATAAPSTSGNDTADAAPDPHASTSGDSRSDKRDAGGDAGRRRKRTPRDAGTDAGDAGTGSKTPSCSSLGSEAASDVGLCSDRFEDWCESDAVLTDCASRAVTRDEGVFGAYLDCLDELFEEPDWCDESETARAAAAAKCAETADETACIEHNEGCDVYAGCEEYTVDECNASVAKFNARSVRYASPYFECRVPPDAVLGR